MVGPIPAATASDHRHTSIYTTAKMRAKWGEKRVRRLKSKRRRTRAQCRWATQLHHVRSATTTARTPQKSEPVTRPPRKLDS
ncbi:unnamed protein product [Zymoseptoria tritici ST99CH_3D7]|uniref:60S ribosomal protein L41 n=1 Tax=Zymoseptoria tritici (strain ST99CH_3D7) TaxID=1276538 RepID=A0A1X7RD45_ZYMT9|nr:unnamed protein product [Zymoseptoria tritici ST99CH_3D7]